MLLALQVCTTAQKLKWSELCICLVWVLDFPEHALPLTRTFDVMTSTWTPGVHLQQNSKWWAQFCQDHCRGTTASRSWLPTQEGSHRVVTQVIYLITLLFLTSLSSHYIFFVAGAVIKLPITFFIASVLEI